MMVHCSSNRSSPDRGAEDPCSIHVNQTKSMLTTIPSVHHYCPVHPQKEAESILDLMLLWFSLLDFVTKLASPFCRRLLCAAFCCLVSCLRTFWRTTSYRTHKNKDSRLLQMNAALSLQGRQNTVWICFLCYTWQYESSLATPTGHSSCV